MPIKEKTIKVYVCSKCDHEWMDRKKRRRLPKKELKELFSYMFITKEDKEKFKLKYFNQILPFKCPKCKSPLWNE